MVKALVVIGVVLVVALIGVAYWFYVYSGDLPNLDQFALFAPDQRRVAEDPCSHLSVTAIPASEMNKWVRAAITVDEAPPTDPEFAWNVAFNQASCNFPSGWQIISKAKRLSGHLKKRFTPEQLLAIDLNTHRFGFRTVGIEAVAQQKFSKPARELELQEAALLFLEPGYEDEKPDLLLQKRNTFMDTMAAQHLITTEEAATAKAQPLPSTK